MIDLNEVPPSMLSSAISVFDGKSDNGDIVVPTVGMSFENGDEFAAFIYSYAYKTGFEVTIRNSILKQRFKDELKDSVGEGKVKKEPRFYMRQRIRFICKKGGVDRGKNYNVTGCKVCFDAKEEVLDGQMILRIVFLEHNHVVDPTNSPNMVSFREINSYFKSRMVINDEAGIPIIKNFNALAQEAGGIEYLPFNRRDLRNAVNLKRRIDVLGGDAVALLEYFEKLKGENPDFFFEIEVDDEYRLKNVFWADARCRAMCKVFGDVVTFDTTFLSNRYLKLSIYVYN